MFTDIMGQVRQKVALHNHSEMSDGKRPPDEIARIYEEAGYDALTFTEHWFWNPVGHYKTMTILSGAEYNIGGKNAMDGVYHITAIGCTSSPRIGKKDSPQKIAAAIHRANGIAILAHPAWSLNDPAKVAAMKGFDAVEIYNTTSGVHHNCRADASCFVDQLACRGRRLPLVAVDDAHWYTSDHTRSWICVESDSNRSDALITAIRAGKFYASQGPEIHLRREGNRIVLDCTPAVEILFYSNVVYVCGRAVRGEDLTHAEYEIVPDTKDEKGKTIAGDRFVRAEVVDAQGNRAWSNFIEIGDETRR
ncbi:MAG: hypothetical protein IKC50_03305 [Oscillospiraceae bacterium]|nr:hypothetical protein [Oscillospiraceae bacterium]